VATGELAEGNPPIVLLSPDYGAHPPLWIVRADRSERLADQGWGDRLPPELIEQLDAWCQVWEKETLDFSAASWPPDLWREWTRSALSLAELVQRQLPTWIVALDDQEMEAWQLMRPLWD